MNSHALPNKNIFDCTTPNGIEQFWQFISSKTKKEFSTDPTVKEAIQNVIIKFDNNSYVALEGFLGAGFFSYAFKVAEYDFLNGKKTENKLVLKMPKPLYKNSIKLHLQHLASQYIFNLSKDFQKEATLFQKMSGKTQLNTYQVKGKPMTFSLIPFLGDTPISALMKDASLLHRIPTKEWLQLFLQVLKKLDEFHQKTGFLHNDIRPGNIILVLKELPDGLMGFQSVNLIDFGNSHLRKTCGRFGSNSPIINVPGVIIPFKDYNIDIHALGKTLLDVLHTLKKVNTPDLDKFVMDTCKITFKKMTSLIHKFPLANAIAEMQLICDSYDKVVGHEEACSRSVNYKMPCRR